MSEEWIDAHELIDDIIDHMDYLEMDTCIDTITNEFEDQLELLKKVDLKKYQKIISALETISRYQETAWHCHRLVFEELTKL